MAHNVLRAAGSLASLAYGKARGATLRRDLIDVAARTARHGRGHITLHLPDGWHRQAGVDEPVHRRLRAAIGSGLTSPNPVTAPTRPHGPPSSGPERRNPGQAAGHVSGRKRTDKSAAKITSISH